MSSSIECNDALQTSYGAFLPPPGREYEALKLFLFNLIKQFCKDELFIPTDMSCCTILYYALSCYKHD